MIGIATKNWAGLPRWVSVAAGAALTGLAGAAEFAMGRKLWGVSGKPGIWSGDIWSSHNSQYMTDPYSFQPHYTRRVVVWAAGAGREKAAAARAS
jgi:hypothetical protein